MVVLPFEHRTQIFKKKLRLWLVVRNRTVFQVTTDWQRAGNGYIAMDNKNKSYTRRALSMNENQGCNLKKTKMNLVEDH